MRLSGAFDELGLGDRLDDIVFRCRLDPFKALADEYKRRVRDAKQAGFLGHFLECHPGVQHKAGVPLGGTFILVYHELPTAVAAPASPAGAGDVAIEDPGGIRIGLQNTFRLDELNANLLSNALARLQYKEKLAEDPDLQVLYKVVTGNVLVPRLPVAKFAGRGLPRRGRQPARRHRHRRLLPAVRMLLGLPADPVPAPARASAAERGQGVHGRRRGRGGHAHD